MDLTCLLPLIQDVEPSVEAIDAQLRSLDIAEPDYIISHWIDVDDLDLQDLHCLLYIKGKVLVPYWMLACICFLSCLETLVAI